MYMRSLLVRYIELNISEVQLARQRICPWLLQMNVRVYIDWWCYPIQMSYIDNSIEEKMCMDKIIKKRVE